MRRIPVLFVHTPDGHLRVSAAYVRAASQREGGCKGKEAAQAPPDHCRQRSRCPRSAICSLSCCSDASFTMSWALHLTTTRRCDLISP